MGLGVGWEVVSIHRMTIQLHHVVTILPVSCENLSDVPYRTPRSGGISTVQLRSKLPHILHIIPFHLHSYRLSQPASYPEHHSLCEDRASQLKAHSYDIVPEFWWLGHTKLVPCQKKIGIDEIERVVDPYAVPSEV
jgi:hypothetical protein